MMKLKIYLNQRNKTQIMNQVEFYHQHELNQEQEQVGVQKEIRVEMERHKKVSNLLSLPSSLINLKDQSSWKMNMKNKGLQVYEKIKEIDNKFMMAIYTKVISEINKSDPKIPNIYPTSIITI